MGPRRDDYLSHPAHAPVNQLPPTPPDTEDNDSDITDEVGFPLAPPSKVPDVLELDKKTPDAHVPRDARLIRLTGVHPFNVEPPLSDLYNSGFLTPPELWYVRNHGAVPEVRDEDIPNWEFSVEGLVEKPFTLTLKQLMSSEYDQVTYPVTMVCAGNRRKEQNQVRKSKGFSWGAAGLSTALFTGVLMAEVINRARPLRRAKYVCMEGAEDLPNGRYQTCQKLNWVRDPNKGIMLAYKMNGEMLRPDHGKPLRAVVPGQIGGRSVKWLKKLILTEAPSDNWYHIYDNRVLPTMITPEESANLPDTWRDERYAIYDLNVNSAVAYPAHNEKLNISSGNANDDEKYRVRGYAYGGGGRRVTRVEISLDQGRTWTLSDVEYAEDLYREAGEQRLYGGRLDMGWRETCFCWCFWSLDVSFKQLKSSKDILVRCMDESLALQPRDMYWSVLGMMNNPWFRVAIIHEGDELRFEHPNQPALMPGGWMDRVKKAGGNLTNGFWGEKLAGEEDDAAAVEPAKEVKMTKDDVKRTITIEELREHEAEDHPWFVVNGEVYDGTGFLKDHPGGAQSIVSAAAQDATDEFMAIHSENAKAMMPDYHIGTLDEQAKKILADGEADSGVVSTEKRPTFLQARAWTKAELVGRNEVSWDTRIFTFKLEHDEQTLGLPIGQHLMVRLRDPKTGEAIIRAYTPISETQQKGHLEMLVKVYFDQGDVKGGKMSQAMDTMPIGQHVEFKGPIGKFTYLGGGRCSVNGNIRTVKSFAMICAGSGVTPIFQVLRAVMTDATDPTRCVVFNGNRLVEDILCKAQLDALADGALDKCKLLYTLTKADDDWKGLRGRVTAELVDQHVENDGETLLLICGPEALEVGIVKAMKAQGWKEEDLLRF